VEELTFTELVMFEFVPVAPLMPSAPEPVEVTLPVAVIVKGLPVVFKTTGPLIAVLIVGLIETAPKYQMRQ